jgi:hypothetical protein
VLRGRVRLIQLSANVCRGQYYGSLFLKSLFTK